MRHLASLSVLFSLGLALWAALPVAARDAAWLPLILAPARATATPTRTATPTPSRTPTRTVTPDASEALAAQVIALTNQERASRGLAPLQANDALMRAAAAHSLDMATHNFVDHVGSDGSTPGQRITRASYAWQAYGENIAAGYATAQQVVAAWMGSAGHRANILNPDFQHIGVAYVYRSGTTYGGYWTQVFGRPW
jgi:uncharacterized protein YkwD